MIRSNYLVLVAVFAFSTLFAGCYQDSDPELKQQPLSAKSKVCAQMDDALSAPDGLTSETVASWKAQGCLETAPAQKTSLLGRRECFQTTSGTVCYTCWQTPWGLLCGNPQSSRSRTLDSDLKTTNQTETSSAGGIDCFETTRGYVCYACHLSIIGWWCSDPFSPM